MTAAVDSFANTFNPYAEAAVAGIMIIALMVRRSRRLAQLQEESTLPMIAVPEALALAPAAPAARRQPRTLLRTEDYNPAVHGVIGAAIPVSRHHHFNTVSLTIDQC